MLYLSNAPLALRIGLYGVDNPVDLSAIFKTFT